MRTITYMFNISISYRSLLNRYQRSSNIFSVNPETYMKQLSLSIIWTSSFPNLWKIMNLDRSISLNVKYHFQNLFSRFLCFNQLKLIKYEWRMSWKTLINDEFVLSQLYVYVYLDFLLKNHFFMELKNSQYFNR